MKENKRDTAAVFMSGTSQAVRLPKQYRFKTARVLIERQGDTVILTPALETWADICTGKPEDIENWLQVTSDDDLEQLEEREGFK
jgi:antitoxin VapB